MLYHDLRISVGTVPTLCRKLREIVGLWESVGCFLGWFFAIERKCWVEDNPEKSPGQNVSEGKCPRMICCVPTVSDHCKKVNQIKYTSCCGTTALYASLKNFSPIWRRHLGLCSAFRAFWAGRDLYRAILAVTRDLGFSSLIRRVIQSPLTNCMGMRMIFYNPDPQGSPFSRLLRYSKGCWGVKRFSIALKTSKPTLNQQQ
jgi:hypothetical protein